MDPLSKLAGLGEPSLRIRLTSGDRVFQTDDDLTVQAAAVRFSLPPKAAVKGVWQALDRQCRHKVPYWYHNGPNGRRGSGQTTTA